MVSRDQPGLGGGGVGWWGWGCTGASSFTPPIHPGFFFTQRGKKIIVMRWIWVMVLFFDRFKESRNTSGIISRPGRGGGVTVHLRAAPLETKGSVAMPVSVHCTSQVVCPKKIPWMNHKRHPATPSPHPQHRAHPLPPTTMFSHWKWHHCSSTWLASQHRAESARSEHRCG